MLRLFRPLRMQWPEILGVRQLLFSEVTNPETVVVRVQLQYRYFSRPTFLETGQLLPISSTL